MPSAKRKRGKRQKRSSAGQAFDVPAFLRPQTRAELQDLARLMAAAGWAPDGYRELEGNYVVEKIEMAILHGASVGLGPVAAAQSIAVIEGMPTIWGDGALALVERSGLLEDMSEDYVVDDSEGLTAICTMRRCGRPSPIVNRFSMAMAEQARLTEKEGPWQTYPQRMLRMRARSWTIRDGFADVLRGLQILEEVADYAAPAIAGPHCGSVQARPNTAKPGSLRRVFRRELSSVSSLSPVELGTASGATAQLAQDGIRHDGKTTQGQSAAEIKPEPAIALQTSADNVGSVASFAAVGAEIDGIATEGPACGEAPPDDAARGLAEPFQLEAPGPIYTLVDADGVISEYTDVGALKAALEHILGQDALSPDQKCQIWDCNQSAVYVIKARFGEKALEEVRHRSRPQRAQIAAVEEPRIKPALTPRPRRQPVARSLGPSVPRRLEIDPGWGEQKIFQHYRARLAELHKGGSGKASLLAQFREANRGLEGRLRQTFPHLIKQIDAIYADAALNAR